MIRTSETVDKISAAWVAAAKAMPNVPKETLGQVGNVQRRYADLATLVETVRPILAEHGLAYIQGVSDGDKVVTISTRLLHESGEWFEDSLSMPTGQNTPQAVGSATTYGRRYSLMAMLGLAPDDDDGAAASAQPKAATRKAAPAPAPRSPDRAATGLITDDGTPPADTTTGELLATPAQIQRLQIAMNGKGDRNSKLRFLAGLVGRELGSSKELTKDEASAVIDHLAREAS